MRKRGLIPKRLLNESSPTGILFEFHRINIRGYCWLGKRSRKYEMRYFIGVMDQAGRRFELRRKATKSHWAKWNREFFSPVRRAYP